MDEVPLSNVVNQSYGVAHDALEDKKETLTPTDVRVVGGTRRKSKPTVIMSILGSLIALSFTFYIFALSFFKSYSLFSWHPFLMTFGTLLLMGGAVMAMSQDNVITGKLARSSRTKIHWILQALAATCIFTGFLIIVINKIIHNKQHFYSWHSVFGLITVIMVAVTDCGGVAALYSIRINQFIQPALIKLIHSIAGILTYICGTVCIILATYSVWFQSHAEGTVHVICVLLVCIIALCTLESAVKSVYGRIQQTIQRP